MNSSTHIPIDNYNGIMLCKRPEYNISFNPTNKEISENEREPSHYTMTRKRKENSAKNEQGSFLCGTVPTPWGNTKSTKLKSEKNKVLSRISKSDGALNRHKQWLREMQEQREKKIREKEEEERLKLEKSKEFMERQSQRRKKIRELESIRSTDNDQDESDEKRNEEIKSLSEQEVDTNNKLKSGEKRSRPIWSLTENEANTVEKNVELSEEKELMDFVDGLDFEQYCDDMELKVLMSQVKDRIQHLEKEKKSDESLLDVVLQSEMAEIQNEKYNGDNSINNNNDDMRALEKDAMNTDYDEIQSITATVKSRSDESISSIHSHKSMLMLVLKSRDRLQSCNSKHFGYLDKIQEENVGFGGETKKNPPKIVKIVEDNGARLAETKSLNKLPFKNRNPAL